MPFHNEPKLWLGFAGKPKLAKGLRIVGACSLSVTFHKTTFSTESGRGDFIGVANKRGHYCMIFPIARMHFPYPERNP